MNPLDPHPLLDGKSELDGAQALWKQTVSRRSMLTLLGTAILSSFTIAPAASASIKAMPKKSNLPASVGIMQLVTGMMHQAWGTHTKTYPVGSLFKLIVASTLLEHRWVNPDDTYECRGSLALDRAHVNCPTPHGKVSLRRAIGVSCNGYFAHYGQRVSTVALTQTCELWGITPVEPFKATKTQRQWADVLLGLSPHMRLSPVDLSRMMARLANDEIDIGASTRAAIIDGMMLAATEGTAKALSSYRRDMAVKTGTIPRAGGHFESWIIGFLPVDQPSVSFAIHMPNGTSRDVAVPEAIRKLKEFMV